MKKVSMLEFRRNAADILQAVSDGESCILTRRGKPMARLEPIAPSEASLRDDPVYSLWKHAEEGGAPLGNEEIDDLLYG